ncbi:hypothetical protein BU17DRAFT_89552 [Hysterangium stoloniferum]|nr:hypothetical protein BU17DRAFT_89552 [Hysterangium stoloniferum]
MPPSRTSKSKPSSLPSLSRRWQNPSRPPSTLPTPMPGVAIAGPTTASPVPAPPSVSPLPIVLPPPSSIVIPPPLTSHTAVSVSTPEGYTWPLFTHHPLHVRQHLKLPPIRSHTPRHPTLPSIQTLFPEMNFGAPMGTVQPQSQNINPLHPTIGFANTNVWQDDYS